MKKKDAYSSMSFWLPSVSANNFFLTTKKTSVTVEGLKINCHGQKEQENLHRVAKVSGPQERAWSLKIAYTGFGHKKQVFLKKKHLLSQFLIVSLLWTPVRAISLSNSVEGNDQLRVAQSEFTNITRQVLFVKQGILAVYHSSTEKGYIFFFLIWALIYIN